MIEIVEYDPEWPQLFARYRSGIRSVAGDAVARIDHIGSTSVPHVAAKPIIDIQISVEEWSAFDLVQTGLGSIGYRWHPDNPDRNKYENAKRGLVLRSWPSVDDYADAKGDIIWMLLREADEWAWTNGWSVGPTDL